MESSLVNGNHIDFTFIAESQKKKLIRRLLMRAEIMLDEKFGSASKSKLIINTLAVHWLTAADSNIDRLWVLGKNLIEVTEKKFERLEAWAWEARLVHFQLSILVLQALLSAMRTRSQSQLDQSTR